MQCPGKQRDSVGSAKIFLEIDLRLPATKYDSSTGMKDKAKSTAYSSAAWSAFSSTSGPSMWDLSEYLMSTPFKLLSLHMSIVVTEALKRLNIPKTYRLATAPRHHLPA